MSTASEICLAQCFALAKANENWNVNEMRAMAASGCLDKDELIAQILTQTNWSPEEAEVIVEYKFHDPQTPYTMATVRRLATATGS